MVVDSPLLFFQQDFLSLQDYLEHRNVSIDAVKRRMLVNLRKCNLSVPDHYINLNNQKTFSRVTSFVSLLTYAFPVLANEFLEYDKRNKTVFVKESHFIQWQDIIGFVSPLFLISCCIYGNECFINSFEEIRDVLFQKCIKTNTLNTAIISPNIIQINKLMEEYGGFYDLHLHLNGIVEADTVWESILYSTDKFLSSIKEKYNKYEFKQELEQIGVFFGIKEIYRLLERAKEIRSTLFSFCFSIENADFTASLHPFTSIYHDKKYIETSSELLRYEALMYVLSLRYIFEHDNNKVAMLLHEYLLIKGFIIKLLVHTKEKVGFEQFQNITKNDIREDADRNHLTKFLQLSGNSYKNFKKLELRFSPKDVEEKNIDTITSIQESWNKFSQRAGQECLSYYLIAHFIKTKPDKNRKYKYLRTSLKERAEVLLTTFNNKKDCKLVGVDAAASEFDTPPEVFAPVYNYLRNNGIRHFTYHAGEDFYHILSGLRGIYEAIVFCGLKNGDRIGHACAAGIDIALWKETLGNDIYIPHGEYIDDLLFVYIFIIDEKIDDLSYLLPKLANIIVSGYQEIFTVDASIVEISQAWRLRKEDPETLDYTLFSDNLKKIIYSYNNTEFYKSYTIPKKIKIDSDLSIDEMNIVQKHLLKFMHEREIVIESLPTSNLRIGWHNSLDTYQLFNWYKWKKEGLSVPPIVLGTDDPGIFQTNIYNEYSLIFCHMVYKLGISRTDAISFIKELVETSKTYIFC